MISKVCAQRANFVNDDFNNEKWAEEGFKINDCIKWMNNR